jgi:PAS domain-containing protein
MKAKAPVSNFEERDRLQNALRKSEGKFVSALLSNPAVVTICDLKDNRLIKVNEAFEKISAYSHAEAIGHPANELGIWADPDEFNESVKQFHAGAVFAISNTASEGRMATLLQA